MYKLLIVFSLLLLSCLEEPQPPDGTIKLLYTNCEYRTIVIDSCEYVYIFQGNGSWGSHKGNCKFCAKRKE